MAKSAVGAEIQGWAQTVVTMMGGVRETENTVSVTTKIAKSHRSRKIVFTRDSVVAYQKGPNGFVTVKSYRDVFDGALGVDNASTDITTDDGGWVCVKIEGKEIYVNGNAVELVIEGLPFDNRGAAPKKTGPKRKPGRPRKNPKPEEAEEDSDDDDGDEEEEQPRPKKRGRPKGSKNKPKVEVEESEDDDNGDDDDFSDDDDGDEEEEQPRPKKRGRPKGSKNKPKVAGKKKVKVVDEDEDDDGDGDDDEADW